MVEYKINNYTLQCTYLSTIPIHNNVLCYMREKRIQPITILITATNYKLAVHFLNYVFYVYNMVSEIFILITCKLMHVIIFYDETFRILSNKIELIFDFQIFFLILYIIVIFRYLSKFLIINNNIPKYKYKSIFKV